MRGQGDFLSHLEQLAKAAAAVRDHCPSPSVWAIPWMNFKHPTHPTQKRLLQTVGRQEHSPLTILGLAGGAIATGLYALLFTARLGWLRLRWYRQTRAWEGITYELIGKTWCFDPPPSHQFNDFYFGDLLRRLGERGVRTLLIWGDSRGRNWRFRALPQPGDCAYLPELILAPLNAPLAMWWNQLRSALRLRRLARKSRDEEIRAVAREASRECLSHRILPVGIYYWIGREAVRRFRPRAFLSLYEGHGWEQCLWRGIESSDARCAILGYQHTVLQPHNLALTRQGTEGGISLHPHGVLCLGPHTRRLMEPSHLGSDLQVFGSFRYHPATVSSAPRPQSRQVLVLPEGHAEEAVLLFEAAAAAAERLPNHRFILRCHPVLPFDKVRGLLARDPLRLPNVELSKNRSIAEDMACSSVVLYRGSSAVLYAILSGLKPIYLENREWGEIDPLFELQDWRERVDGAEEFVAALQRFSEIGAEGERQWQEATRYVREYAVPVDDLSIEGLIRWIRPSQVEAVA